MDDLKNVRRTFGALLSAAMCSARECTWLAARAAAGDFSQAVADDLFAASPFQRDQLGGRKDMFWMTSHPVAADGW